MAGRPPPVKCIAGTNIQDDRDSARPAPRLLSPGQFSIGALLLLTMWIAVCLAIYRFSPVIGVALGIWTVPGVIRTLIVVQFWKPRVQLLSAGDLYEIFGHSLILAAAAELAALFAFGMAAIVCKLIAASIGLPAQASAVFSLASGIFSAVAAVCFVFWLGRPSRFDRPA